MSRGALHHFLVREVLIFNKYYFIIIRISQPTAARRMICIFF